MKNTWYLILKPLHPWHLAPRNEARINESISENFCLDNHHSENTGNGIPPRLPTEKKGASVLNGNLCFFKNKNIREHYVIVMHQLSKNLNPSGEALMIGFISTVYEKCSYYIFLPVFGGRGG